MELKYEQLHKLFGCVVDMPIVEVLKCLKQDARSLKISGNKGLEMSGKNWVCTETDTARQLHSNL